MKKFKKVIAMFLAAVMAMSVMSVSVFADTNEEFESEIRFVVIEDGVEVEVLEPIYIEEVAERYEAEKMQRWASTTYYNLANGAYTISGGTASIVQCNRHFSPNSSNRLYYYGEVTGASSVLNIYDVTNGTYKGSFLLQSQGGGVYSRNGYITGLSSSCYYSYGISAQSTVNFTSYYGAISWTSL